ncbi:MAG: hypothetical protein IT462_00955 [Planctomycetes bacterium]|nr:hypothetical protein [Planctomycetota bacterium]
MNSATDNFEAFLRSGLKAAAAKAPQAPSVFVIRQTLRRRSVTRAAWMSVAAGLALAAGFLFAPILAGDMSVQTAVDHWKSKVFPPGKAIFPNPARDPFPSRQNVEPSVVEPDVVPVAVPAKPVSTPEPQTTLVAALAPLDDDADMFVLRASLAGYFAAHGITRAEIAKEPGVDLDFVLRAEGVVDFAQVTIDIESLLKNYSRASLSFKDNDITCWLLARTAREQ